MSVCPPPPGGRILEPTVCLQTMIPGDIILMCALPRPCVKHRSAITPLSPSLLSALLCLKRVVDTVLLIREYRTWRSNDENSVTACLHMHPLRTCAPPQTCCWVTCGSCATQPPPATSRMPPSPRPPQPATQPQSLPHTCMPPQTHAHVTS
jgi:hypothetical protein